MQRKWLIYGANGYTGRLIVERARQVGMEPVLAGRNAEQIRSLAASTGLNYTVFNLDDASAAYRALNGVSVLLHCAGPFSATSQQMIGACLANRCHYLDITGEISVFKNAHRQADEARRADIVLLPGAGFDVVPTDCLAATLVGELPAATSLALAFMGDGRISPGTAKTSFEGLARGGCVRRDGKLKRVPLGWKTREIPFANGPRLAVTIPWGDVFTAHVSTGIPDIEVYTAISEVAVKRLRRLQRIRPLLGLKWIQNQAKRRIERTFKGPDEERRKQSCMQVWGEVRSGDGRSLSATMTTPDGYDLTAEASLGIVRFLLENEVEGGFYTPSLLMGADYARGLPGVRMRLNP